MQIDRDKVIPYGIGFEPEAAVSGPVLLQTDYRAFLTFNAVKMISHGTRNTAGTGIIELIKCHATKFGYPNDEALPGHPLYLQGLTCYGVFEVLGSSWIRQQTEQNRVSFPNTPDDSASRHFVFTFHDSTFECIAADLQASLSAEPYHEIIARITQAILSD